MMKDKEKGGWVGSREGRGGRGEGGGEEVGVCCDHACFFIEEEESQVSSTLAAFLLLNLRVCLLSSCLFVSLVYGP